MNEWLNQSINQSMKRILCTDVFINKAKPIWHQNRSKCMGKKRKEEKREQQYNRKEFSIQWNILRSKNHNGEKSCMNMDGFLEPSGCYNGHPFWHLYNIPRTSHSCYRSICNISDRHWTKYYECWWLSYQYWNPGPVCTRRLNVNTSKTLLWINT